VLLDLTGFYQALPVNGIDDPATQKVEMWNLGILSRDCYALRDNLLLDNEEVAIKELSFFKKAGGNTVVDASLDGIGRDPLALKRISEATGLNIIMGTGFYVGATHPEYLDRMSDEEIANKIGLKKSSFSQKKNGQRNFTIEEAIDLAELLNLNYVDFKQIWGNGVNNYE
jgi:predicted metal-dependent phosphotriesterase family hydrolase